jgi:hypothetical protein
VFRSEQLARLEGAEEYSVKQPITPQAFNQTMKPSELVGIMKSDCHGMSVFAERIGIFDSNVI